MEALYKLFALSFIAEREAYRNVQSWENIAQLNGQPEPDYLTDKVYASLVNVWSEAESPRRLLCRRTARRRRQAPSR
jgi:hypothetical protein